ncbi:sialic acid-binding Ig-like lectin 13 [Eleutherodactylus coqui]|uniref:sialic acid-binding Ig-like lectin 13 n=1 Tax=Eleutherodactylus coqui TaxID=57060 RepID=UPI003462DE3D
MCFKKNWFFVNYYLALILIGSQLWSNTVCQRSSGYRISTNSSVRVQRGLCVHVPCSFSVPSNVQLSIRTIGIWYILRDGYFHPWVSKTNIEHRTNGRFFMTGNVASGDCSYYIEDPLPEDEAIYVFRFDDVHVRFTYVSIQPSVSVTELTDKPTISSTRLVNGEEVTFTCTSPGRCWNIMPNILWEVNMTGISLKTYNITYEDGSRTFHSNITFTPRKSDNKALLFCRVTLKDDLTTVEKQTLNVEYSPSINITIEGVDPDDASTVTVKDGDSLTLKCIVDSNPNASITWRKDGKVLPQTVSDQIVILELINLAVSDVGRFQCSATNEHGVTLRTVEVIHHGTQLQFTTVMAAAVGGAILLVLIIVITALLLMSFRKKRQQHINEKLKDKSNNDTEDIYCYPDFTIHNVISPEETIQKELQSSAGDDSVYMNPDDVQYSSIAFSKLKPKIFVNEDVEMEYSEIKKTQY